MKKVFRNSFAIQQIPLVFGMEFVFLMFLFLNTGCKKQKSPTPEMPTDNLSVSAPGLKGKIYLDGRYTGYSTPHNFLTEAGKHTVGVGVDADSTYLRKTVTVPEDGKADVQLTQADRQKAKIWKVLFVGIYHAANSSGTDVLSYQKSDLDLAFDFLKYSFHKYIEPDTYHTIKWEFYRQDIMKDTVRTNSNNLLSPELFQKYMPGLKTGEYDLVIPFYRFEGDAQHPSLGTFNGMAWYDVHSLYCTASYYMIRYYSDVASHIQYMKENDPGMFVHEWCHTITEQFYNIKYYPDHGYPMPDPNLGGGSVVHAASGYGYSAPWMTWYHDLISGQVKSKKSDTYLGVGPDAFLKCTIREYATSQCSK